jgi:hypothetical protein
LGHLFRDGSIRHVRFGLVHAPDGTFRGRIDFDLPLEPSQGLPQTIFTLHFDRRGNMLESASDAFGNRRIIDEHDVPVILRRFLVTYLKE